ncbi:MAG: hypothetical protein HQM02_13905, partial [Magnetococcales bacterium]|nr:hypothetical protein [Magnetococcales bacterium]
MSGSESSEEVAALRSVALYLLFPLFVVGMLGIIHGVDLGILHARVFERLFALQEPMAGGLWLATLPLAWWTARSGRGVAFLDRWLPVLGRHPWRVAALALPFMVAGTRWGYHAYPLAMDEFLPYFQAQVFASGRLWAEFPPDLVRWLMGNSVLTTINDQTGKMISNYWPGFALLLTPFTLVGLPWLLNPLLGALSVGLIGHLARRWLPEPDLAAGWATLLAVASPVLLVNAISYY